MAAWMRSALAFEGVEDALAVPGSELRLFGKPRILRQTAHGRGAGARPQPPMKRAPAPNAPRARLNRLLTRHINPRGQTALSA